VTTGVDFLKEAQQLLGTARSSEIRCRTSISRAYYGAFHTVSQIASRLGYKFDSSAGLGIHEHMIAWLRHHSNRSVRNLSSFLADMKGKRHRADYALHHRVEYHEAQEAVETAAFMIDEVCSELGDGS